MDAIGNKHVGLISIDLQVWAVQKRHNFITLRYDDIIIRTFFVIFLFKMCHVVYINESKTYTEHIIEQKCGPRLAISCYVMNITFSEGMIWIQNRNDHDVIMTIMA